MTGGALNIADLAAWGLQTGLMVSLLIGLVLIIRRPFARYFGAGAAYALWLLPLIRLFMPTFTLPFIRRMAPEPLVEVPISVTVAAEPVLQLPSTMPPVVEFTSLWSSLDVWLVVTALWLGIACVWLVFQLLRQRTFMKRMKATSQSAPHSLDAPIAEAMSAVGLSKRPNIRLSSEVSGPMVTGVANPLILLPIDFESRFKPEQRGFALVHEMAHIKRGDLWVALVTLFYRALFWPNPLVHYAAHKLRVDQEAACDASVVAKTGGEAVTHSYAETLLHAAKTAGQNTSRNTPLGLALTDTDLTNTDMHSNKERDNDEMA